MKNIIQVILFQESFPPYTLKALSFGNMCTIAIGKAQTNIAKSSQQNLPFSHFHALEHVDADQIPLK